jgi:hypothetical protein
MGGSTEAKTAQETNSQGPYRYERHEREGGRFSAEKFIHDFRTL